ncbi:hypothetical protein [Paenibacillus glycanilyticus]|uniref:Uncharacterized protein n=1 Tax=Paenibacillus glycanilyticus TaxID=126569 RepID=A0ABQ6G9M9_9BACL|nr:hypothetical protein [Paenibacillus glycanilyticus]GLX66392.1 hypothetical protein MU1_07360 [Paenibacillus glycanilyticus]
MRNILVFVLFAAMVCWMMFSPIYKHVLIARQAVLQQETDYLLEVGASGSYGYIDDAMMEQSKGRLAAFGMRPERVQFEVTADNGLPASDPASPLPRGTGMMLRMSYPYEDLFQIDRLIGLAPVSPDSRMRTFGMKMSEFMP